MRWAGLLALAVGCALPCVAVGDGSDAGGRVYATAEAVEPLAPGARVPEAPLRNVRGEPTDLSAVLAGRGALLVFYRGGW